MQIDPLAEFAPDLTPYRFGFNNPEDVIIRISNQPVGTTKIRLIDSENVTGAPATVEVPIYAMTVTDDVTGTISTYHVIRDGPVIDGNNPANSAGLWRLLGYGDTYKSDNNVNMEEALNSVKSMVESSFQGENINGMDINMELNFSVAESMDDVSDSDHLLVLAEGKIDKIPGVSNELGGKVTAVDADYFTGLYDRFIGEEGERTSAHELGHLFSLTHDSGGKDSNNLMTQGEAHKRGNEVTKGQLNAIVNNLNGNRLNQGSNFNLQGLPNLGHGARVMRLTNTAGRNRKMAMKEIQKMINKN